MASCIHTTGSQQRCNISLVFAQVLYWIHHTVPMLMFLFLTRVRMVLSVLCKYMWSVILLKEISAHFDPCNISRSLKQAFHLTDLHQSMFVKPKTCFKQKEILHRSKCVEISDTLILSAPWQSVSRVKCQSSSIYCKCDLTNYAEGLQKKKGTETRKTIDCLFNITQSFVVNWCFIRSLNSKPTEILPLPADGKIQVLGLQWAKQQHLSATKGPVRDVF